MIRVTRYTGRIARFIFLVALFVTGCTSSTQAWQRIQSTGTLRVGLDPTYPPFETADDGELRGIDVDLARALGRELDLDVEFVYFGYDGLYDALVSEQADVLISALVIRSDQTRDFAYSEPYFNAGQLLAVSRQNADIGAMEDLTGRTLAVELGAQGHVIATEWERQLPDLAIEPYQTPDEALEAVARGQTDAALVDAISARLYLAQNDSLRLLNPPVTVEPFVMVVRKDDERLLQELDAALGTLEDNGQLQSIIERHMLTPASS
jgi:polar amino acid transport system substrate-binding protein